MEDVGERSRLAVHNYAAVILEREFRLQLTIVPVMTEPQSTL